MRRTHTTKCACTMYKTPTNKTIKLVFSVVLNCEMIDSAVSVQNERHEGNAVGDISQECKSQRYFSLASNSSGSRFLSAWSSAILFFLCLGL